MAGDERKNSQPGSPKETRSPEVLDTGSKHTSPRGSKSPKANPGSTLASPKEGSPQAPLVAGILPAQHWIDTAQVRSFYPVNYGTKIGLGQLVS